MNKKSNINNFDKITKFHNIKDDFEVNHDLDNYNINKYLGNYDFIGNIEILGFKGEISSISETLDTIDEIKNRCCDGCLIQLMDAEAVAGKKHLLHAVFHAIKAFEKNENLANDLGIEILLRISTQRQISRAFNILGLKNKKMDIAVVMIDCPDYFIDELNNIFQRDDTVLEANNLILKDLYNISNKELDLMDIESILIDRSTKLIVDY